jgi:hypothetical protein
MTITIELPADLEERFMTLSDDDRADYLQRVTDFAIATLNEYIEVAKLAERGTADESS